MRVIPVLVALVSAVGHVSANPVARTAYAVKETHSLPRQWKNVGRAPLDHVIDLQIGLVQNRFAELEKHLYEVSDPDHSRYGAHLSKDEVEDLVRPSVEAHDRVHEWLADHGVAAHQLRYSAAKDWVMVSLPVESIERLLDTKYSTYEHEDGTSLLRTLSWSLPQHLHEHIDTIQPTNSFFRAIQQRKMLKPVSQVGSVTLSQPLVADSNATTDAACNPNQVTSQCLRTYYETINYKPQSISKNGVGLCDYDGESNNRSDIALFLRKFRPEAEKAADTFKVVVINGGNNQQTPETPAQLKAGKDEEGNLDAETILGIDHPIPLTAFTTGGHPKAFKPDKVTPTNSNEPYLAWLEHVLKLPKIPQVISTSYGDDEQTVPLSYAVRVCNQFAQLGARGVSVLFASGDSGVGSTVASQCVTNDGKNTRTFLPSFPLTCPFVTGVGATKNFNPEVAAFDPRNGFASGGGYSNYFPIPAYQKATVEAYTKSLGGKYNGLYNKTGRAYPEISAQGQSFVVVWNGKGILLDGTSASTPTASAIVALVNDVLLAHGKSVLGFLNPFIYKHGLQAFHDITSGSALGCGVKGFPAVKGWDPVTGFGTPKFTAFKAAALAAAKASSKA